MAGALVPPLLPFQLQTLGRFWKVEPGRQGSASGGDSRPAFCVGPSAVYPVATFPKPSLAWPRRGLRAHLDACQAAFSPAPQL